MPKSDAASCLHRCIHTYMHTCTSLAMCLLTAVWIVAPNVMPKSESTADSGLCLPISSNSYLAKIELSITTLSITANWSPRHLRGPAPVCVCVCVCMYIYIYMCVCVSVCVCMYFSYDILMYICMHMYTYISMGFYMYKQSLPITTNWLPRHLGGPNPVCMYTHTFIWTHTHT